MLSARDISKSFGASLLKALAAVFPWDTGTVTLEGAPYVPRSLAEAEARGVALVFQELNVNRSLTVAENIMLGRLRTYRRFRLIDWKRLKTDAQAILDRLDSGISVSADIDSLDLGQIAPDPRGATDTIVVVVHRPPKLAGCAAAGSPAPTVGRAERCCPERLRHRTACVRPGLPNRHEGPEPQPGE